MSESTIQNNLTNKRFEINPASLDLSSLFYLASGEDVYKTRQSVLDQFKQSPNADIYCQALMDNLFNWERGSDKEKPLKPQYKNYPKTIESAENFFITKQENSVNLDELAPAISWVGKVLKNLKIAS